MNTREYNECVKLYSDGIFRFIVKNMRDEYEAENVVQNTFEKLWVRKDQVVMKTAKAFLFKVAYNNMIDIIRKNKRHVDISEARDLSGESHEYDNLIEYVNKAVAMLPEKQKSAITLRDYEGHDYKSIGEITGMTEGQVKINIFRARKFIKEYVKKLELLTL
jgi:RNA polymerase sigma-70 factor (ECF subfamily)